MKAIDYLNDLNNEKEDGVTSVAMDVGRMSDKISKRTEALEEDIQEGLDSASQIVFDPEELPKERIKDMIEALKALMV